MCSNAPAVVFLVDFGKCDKYLFITIDTTGHNRVQFSRLLCRDQITCITTTCPAKGVIFIFTHCYAPMHLKINVNFLTFCYCNTPSILRAQP